MRAAPRLAACFACCAVQNVPPEKLFTRERAVQQLLDTPFLLLCLGVLIPMVVDTLWGVIDILTIPLAK